MCAAPTSSCTASSPASPCSASADGGDLLEDREEVGAQLLGILRHREVADAGHHCERRTADRLVGLTAQLGAAGPVVLTAQQVHLAARRVDRRGQLA